MNRYKMSKLFLTVMFVLQGSSMLSVSPHYGVCGTIGSLTDWLFTKGDLSENNQKIFAEVVEKLGIKERNIKAKNSGLWIRLTRGYSTSVADALFNRVYLNDTELSKLTDDEKRFIIAKELAHHSKHHYWKKWALCLTLYHLTRRVVDENDDTVKKPSVADKLTPSFIPPIIKGYITGRYGISLLFITYAIGLDVLIGAQYSLVCQKEADTDAVMLAGADAKAGITALGKLLYTPDTTNWPLYAKIQNFFKQIELSIRTLPVIKQHTPHSPSLDERAAYLNSLKKDE